MAARKPTAAEMAVLLLFHAALSGAFLVSYLTGDEDTYRMHVFAGYTVLGALALRIVAGLAAKQGSPLRFPNPSGVELRRWLSRLTGGDPQGRTQARLARSPLLPWMAAMLLAAVAAAGSSGVLADFVTRAEHLHEALGEIALWVVAGHIALILALHWLKRPRMVSADPMSPGLGRG